MLLAGLTTTHTIHQPALVKAIHILLGCYRFCQQDIVDTVRGGICIVHLFRYVPDIKTVILLYTAKKLILLFRR